MRLYWFGIPLAVAGAISVAACSSNGNASTPTAAATATTAPTYTPAAGASATSSPAARARNIERGSATRPVASPAPAGAATVTLAKVAEKLTTKRDSIGFEFRGGMPGYTVAYVANVTQCGSSTPVTLAGAAMLLITFTPAQQPSANGTPVASPPTVAASANGAITGAQQVCDAAGTVQWAVGLASARPFEVLSQNGRLVLSVPLKAA